MLIPFTLTASMLVNTPKIVPPTNYRECYYQTKTVRVDRLKQGQDRFIVDRSWRKSVNDCKLKFEPKSRTPKPGHAPKRRIEP